MKVLIDIPEDYLNDIRKERQTTLWRYAIANGKALSYMTNGDVFMAMFPNAKTWEVTRDDIHCAYIEFKDICEIKSFPLSWWNAPYKKEVEE